ncbi:MAG: aminotransferase class I/II-fold pyridoxal phosphate-dependent enzyme [Spartobacteria bacterium]|nr:aminotransferase class I/II-fold pyridoxal phosphate-dependent enzyme [Spartobacteria bacterium]
MSDSKSLHDRIARHIIDVPRSGIRDFFDIVSTRKDIISLGIGEPDFDAPWHIREATIFALERGASSYTSNLGLLKLRKAVSAYIERTFGLAYSAKTEIIITVGVSEAMDLAVRAILNPGEEVLYHAPCFVSYAPVITFAGGKPVCIETRMEDDFQLSAAAVEEKITPRTKALILNYPNNPTGAVLPMEKLEKIAEVIVRHDLLVIADEIYSELIYEDKISSIAALPGMRDRTIFLHGFSKAWAMTGFRMGYACAPPPLTEAMMKIHQYTMMCASTPSQEAAIEALQQPEVDIRSMHDAYLKRRNYIYNSFHEMGLPCFKPGGAFYAFPYIGDSGLSSYDFAMRLLDEENVAAVPGTAFGACGEGFLRCSYSTSLENIKEAMVRLERFIQRLQK